MIQNILYVLIGATLGALILGVIEANVRIMYIRKISALKIENSKIMAKNRQLFDEKQDLEIQLDGLQELLAASVGDSYIDYSEDW